MILISIASTAAKERSGCDVSVYSRFYDNTPQHVRHEPFRKWIESVLPSPKNAWMYNFIQTFSDFNNKSFDSIRFYGVKLFSKSNFKEAEQRAKDAPEPVCMIQNIHMVHPIRAAPTKHAGLSLLL